MRRLGGMSGVVGAVASVLLLAACSGGTAGAGTTGPSTPTASASTSPATTPSSAPSASAAPRQRATSSTSAGAPASSGRAATGPAVSKLLVVVFENHSAQQATDQMPHLAQLSQQYGRAANWYAVAHPSLPNYLEITGGSTFGVSDDANPAAHPLSGPSVFGQLAAHNHPVAAYAEDMPQNCAQHGEGEYAVKHNAWAYFTDPTERRLCDAHDVPAGTASSGAFRDAVDRGRLPAYAQLIPNLCHDGHDCPLSQADAWLGQWMDLVRSGPDFTSGRLAVVITFDEDDHHADNHVLTVVVARQLHHVVVGQRMTHASLAAAPSRMVGLPPLRGAQGSPDLLKAFGLN